MNHTFRVLQVRSGYQWLKTETMEMDLQRKHPSILTAATPRAVCVTVTVGLRESRGSLSFTSTMCHWGRWNLSHSIVNTGVFTAPPIWSKFLNSGCFIDKRREALFSKHTMLEYFIWSQTFELLHLRFPEGFCVEGIWHFNSLPYLL